MTTADFDFTPEHRAYFDELCLAVKDAQDNPDHWDQSDWHCNTSHCIGGFGDMRRNDLLPQDKWPWERAPVPSAFALDYPYWKANAEIFCGRNTLEMIVEHLEHIRIHGFQYNREGYDRIGRDKDGFDREGYDHEGYDREGYDSDGYNTAGYNRQGYNEDGYDEDGYDRIGHDCKGYDAEGYDREGYDREGYDRMGCDRMGCDRSDLDLND